MNNVGPINVLEVEKFDFKGKIRRVKDILAVMFRK